MTPTFLDQAAAIAPELRAYIAEVSETPLNFEGLDPLHHSAHNHVHLWKIEAFADTHPAITVGFRLAAVNYIFERWKTRLRSYRPYQQAGYRLYLYEDTAPTISVVAQTPTGFPYDGEPQFVTAPKDILRLYRNRSWSAHWQMPELTPELIIATIDTARGSMSSTVARQLGINGAALRRCIEWFEIAEQVNTIRKRYRRRPAQFTQVEALPHRYHIWEKQLPARYGA